MAVDPRALRRWQALLWVTVIWAAIYLPALGSLELKGEEGRRLMPGVTMLQTGQWIVPSMGGVDYLSKPPLINWLAAAAFHLCGDLRSEWAGRLPSVLAVLALGLTMTGALSGWLGPPGALLAAIFTLTNISLMEKGRLAEIDALYISLTGIAITLWLSGWQRQQATAGADASVPFRAGGRWSTWPLPGVILGLGMLAKGPVELLFFYAVVGAILACAGRLRDLWTWPHLAGVVIMLGIFLAWAIPLFEETAGGRVSSVWLAQFLGRLEVNEGFHLGVWLLNIPRGLGNYVPWVVLLPLAWRPRPNGAPGDLDRAIARGLRWAVVGCFLAVSLAPGGQPRYTLPLLAPAGILLALELTRGGGRWPEWVAVGWTRTVMTCVGVAMVSAPLAVVVAGKGWKRLVVAALVLGIGAIIIRRAPRWRTAEYMPTIGLASAAAMGLITADYALGVVPKLRRMESVRPAAAAINHVLADGGERVAVLRPDFLPFLFYLKRPPVYIQTPENLPAAIHYLAVREKEERETETALGQSGAVWRPVLRVNDKRAREAWVLLRQERSPETSL